MTGKTFTIDVESIDLENAILGVSEICAGLKREVLCYTEDGVLHMDRTQSEVDNATDYIKRYHELVQGAVTLIQATSNIIGTALVNDDISIVRGARHKKP